MSIVQMKRLRVILPAEESDSLLRQLSAMGCVELNSPSPPQNIDLPVVQHEMNSNELNEKLAVAKAAIDALKGFTGKEPLLAPKPSVTEKELLDADFSKEYEDAKRVAELTESIKSCDGRIKELSLAAENLKPWQKLDVPLDYRGGRGVSGVFFTIPSAFEPDDVASTSDFNNLPVQIYTASKAKELCYMFALYHVSAEQQMWDVLKPFGALKVNQTLTGTASGNIATLNQRIRDLEKRRKGMKKDIEALADRRDGIKKLYDRLSVDKNRAELQKKLIFTKNAAFMEGWVPAEEEQAVSKILVNRGCAFETETPVIDEEDEAGQPPVVFKSGKFNKSFHFMSELYGMPRYSSIVDPTPFISIFFLIFFGMMMADIGYGLLFVAAALIVTKKAKPEGSVKSAVNVLLYCGISMTFFGVLFGSFFGDVIQQVSKSITGTEFGISPIAFNPMQDPMTMLLVSLGLGLVQIMTGMGLSAYRQIKKGHIFDAICDTGFWYMILLGLVFGVVGFKSGFYTAAAGAAGILIFGGRHKPSIVGKITGGLSSLYDIVGYFSNILSYSRILALCLTSAVVASVMNILGTVAGFNIAGIILFLIIFAVGHVFNLAINVLGAAVHSLRLQYVEFFSYFYEDGGRLFNPAINKTQYINIK